MCVCLCVCVNVGMVVHVGLSVTSECVHVVCLFACGSECMSVCVLVSQCWCGCVPV